ncbi:O-methyltransferase-domain-containing protein [Xylariaceae sp. FL0804]|nr:O-methyltransferase-domain-containing protein [Xylariaceae sp. FL0804]
MDPTKTRIVQLAETIGAATLQLQEVLSKHGAPTPSFDENVSVTYPEAAVQARDAVLDATAELHDMLMEPMALLLEAGAHSNMVSLQAISRFKIASLVPAGGQASFGEIAERTGLGERMVQRLLRYAVTMRVFKEPAPGFVAHTNASKLLMDPTMNDWLGAGSEEAWPAVVKIMDAAQKWPQSEEPNETGFAMANGVTNSIYDIVGSDANRAARFANSMKAFSSNPELSTSHLLDNYDWEGLGATQMVDVGGARGHVAIELASKFHNLDIVVQDFPNIVEGAEASLPEALRGRVTYMPHSFFEEQKVKARLYLFRWVLHNWSDKYVTLILRALIPALESGARILIQDTCMPEPGEVALWRERSLRMTDMTMAAFFNSQERTLAHWEALLRGVDPRLALEDVTQPKGSALAIIELRWT